MKWRMMSIVRWGNGIIIDDKWLNKGVTGVTGTKCRAVAILPDVNIFDLSDAESGAIADSV